jgi:hypothetical protein
VVPSKKPSKVPVQLVVSQLGEKNSLQPIELMNLVGVLGQFQDLQVVGKMQMLILSLTHSVMLEFIKEQMINKTEVGSKITFHLVQLSQLHSQQPHSKLVILLLNKLCAQMQLKTTLVQLLVQQLQ